MATLITIYPKNHGFVKKKGNISFFFPKSSFCGLDSSTAKLLVMPSSNLSAAFFNVDAAQHDQLDSAPLMFAFVLSNVLFES